MSATDASGPPPDRPSGSPRGRIAYVAISLLVVAGVSLGITASLSSSHRNSASSEATSSIGAAADNSTSTTAPPAGASSLKGYLARLTNGAIFIQWTVSDGVLSGSSQAVYLSSDGTATSPQRESITGSIQGTNITLDVQPDGLYGTSNLSGVLQGSGFVVSIPNSDGSLIPVTFVSGTVADYDSAVAALTGQATQGSQAQAQQQAVANAAAAQQKAEQQVMSDGNGVASDIAGLPDDTSGVAHNLAGMKSDLGGEAKDLATVQSDAGAVESEAKQYPGGNSGQVCGDASTAAGDAQTVAEDAQTVDGDAQTIEGDLQTANYDVSSLKSAYQQYLTDLAAVPGYADSQAPTRGQVNDAISSVMASENSTVATANGYIVSANADMSAAYTAAGAAGTSHSCGTDGSAPTPVTTIPS